MAAIPSHIYFRFTVMWRLAFREVKTICIPHFDQISQSMAEIVLLPVAENRRPPYWNSTSVFHFDLFTVISMWFCTGLPNFVRIRRSATVMTSCRYSKMVTSHVSEGSSYLHTKFWPDISIHGRDIITSGSWKQTAAILKFYFRLHFWSFHCYWHVILYWPTRLYAN